MHANRRRWTTAVAVIALAFAAAGCTDPRCNAQNCQTLLLCHEAPSGMIDGECASRWPAEFDSILADGGTNPFVDSCVQACNKSGEGALVACFVQHFPTPAACGDIVDDGGEDAFLSAVDRACPAPTPPPKPNAGELRPQVPMMTGG